MKITLYAHASFRFEGAAAVVVTDPYTPGPQGAGFEPIDEPADLVIMSSATDRFHSDPSHVRGNPTVVNALELPPEGATVQGVPITPFPVMESLTYDYGRNPDDNAMYLFALDGMRVLHLGDVGNAIADEYLTALRGRVDVMLALTGGHATIALDDLDSAIEAIQPRVVIPMHYYSPRGVLNILPATAFTERHPPERVTWVGAATLDLTPETLPVERHIYVLEQSR